MSNIPFKWFTQITTSYVPNVFVHDPEAVRARLHIERESFWLAQHPADDLCRHRLHQTDMNSYIYACCLKQLSCRHCIGDGLDHARPDLKCLWGPGYFKMAWKDAQYNEARILEILQYYPERDTDP